MATTIYTGGEKMTVDFFDTEMRILGITPEVIDSIVKQAEADPELAFKIVNEKMEAEVEVVDGKIKFIYVKHLT